MPAGEWPGGESVDRAQGRQRPSVLLKSALWEEVVEEKQEDQGEAPGQMVRFPCTQPWLSINVGGWEREPGMKHLCMHQFLYNFSY